jgi:mannosyltransferase OCH1-like enzyme
MRKHIGYIIFTIFALTCFFSCSSKKDKQTVKKEIIEVDFDTSMGRGTPGYQLIFSNQEDVRRFLILKDLYIKNAPSKVQSGSEPKIPKIIHQIWVGPKVPPSFFVTFQQKWKALHPDWEYHLWTDSDLEDLNLDLRDIIEQSPNFAEKSDIIRCELLNRFGGVYLDVDMDPFQPLEELHMKYDFYAGLENPHKIASTDNQVWLGISIMGAAAGHPVIKRWKELIRERWDPVNNNHSSPIERVINHTYFPFTYAFFEKYQEENRTNIVLPTTYFYPLAPAQASKRRSSVRSLREKLYDLLEDLHLRKTRPFSRPATETIAVHYWGNSWLPSQSEQLKDLQSQLDMLRKDSYRMQMKLRKFEEMCKNLQPKTKELQGQNQEQNAA